MRSLFYCVLCLLLISCGFQPRGHVPLAPPLHHLFLKTADPYGELTYNLKQYFQSSDIHLTSSPEEAETILEIIKEEPSQQLLGISGTQQTRQYKLILTVTFQITDAKSNIIVPPETLSESRTIPIQANQILGGSNESEQLYRQMRRSIVYNLIYRLASQDITQAIVNKK